VLTNLVGNAIKFTAAGEIAIRVGLVDETAQQARLRFEVRDTGIGIPADARDRLFQSFSQVDASTTRRFGGTGLGLAICARLVERMGGAIGFESQVGKGSTFRFTVRLGRRPDADAIRPRALPELGGVEVLCVDDNATNLRIVTRQLAGWGLVPHAAANAAVALERWHAAHADGRPYKLVVLDMQMPGMDGESLGRIIQADQRLAATRMVMLTSLGLQADAAHFHAIGFAAYLTKPIRHQELKVALALALTHRPEVAPPPPPRATRPPGGETANLFAGRKARILLAEDNITNQMVALGILKQMGLRADAVANGREALQALELLPYDLVLMDVQMPVMDGMSTQSRNVPSSPK
jgi:CheY-like chemotaxis protein